MVRSFSPLIARPVWYDRNPAVQYKTYLGTAVAPHVITTRWTYTVPAGKKAYLEFMFIRARRMTVATTVGQVLASIVFTPSGGSGVEMFSVVFTDNTVYKMEEKTIGMSIVLLAGDKVDGLTWDQSTGGTCDYNVIAKLTEFEA